MFIRHISPRHMYGMESLSIPFSLHSFHSTTLISPMTVTADVEFDRCFQVVIPLDLDSEMGQQW